jgi:parvulin-like peptidyl-prolyl isomerase
MLPIFFAGGIGGGRKPPEADQRAQAIAERDQVAATVGSEKITRGQLDDFERKYISQMSQQAPNPLMLHNLAPQALTMLEDQVMLVAAAKKQGIDVGRSELKAEIDKRVRDEAQKSGVFDLVKEQQQQMLDQMQAGYEAQSDQIKTELITKKLQDKLQKNVDVNSPLLKPEDVEINARHILIQWKGLKSAEKNPKITRTKEEAKALATKLTAEAQKDPSGFAVLAQKNSDEPGADKRAGDLGWFGKNMMVKPFWDAAYAAKVNTIVGPVESAFGYHVIKIEDRRVSQARQAQEVQKFLEAERKKVKPVIVASDLKAAEALSDYRQNMSNKDKKVVESKRNAAIAAYEAASRDRPHDSAIFGLMGTLYRDAHQNDKAIDAFQKSAAIDPSAEIHLALGEMYRTSIASAKTPDDRKRYRQEAIDEFVKAGRLDSTNIQIHQMMLMAFQQMGEKELAAQQKQWVDRANKNTATQRPPIRVGG